MMNEFAAREMAMIRTYSDAVILGGIGQLSRNNGWPIRLQQLLAEKRRRKI